MCITFSGVYVCVSDEHQGHVNNWRNLKKNKRKLIKGVKM